MQTSMIIAAVLTSMGVFRNVVIMSAHLYALPLLSGWTP